MDCPRIRENLSAYIDGQVSKEMSLAIEEHLKTCPSCRKYHEDLLTMKESLRSLPEIQPPKHLHAKVMNGILEASASREHDKGKRSALSPFARRWAPLALAACLLIAFSSFGTLFVVQRWPGLLAQFQSGKEAQPPSGPEKSDGLDETVRGTPSGGIGTRGPDGNEAKAPGGAYKMSPSAVPGATQKGIEGTSSYSLDSLMAAVGQKMVRSAHLSIEVSRGGVERASMAAVQMVEKLQGYVENSQSSSSEKEKGKVSNYCMTARVPSDKLEQILSEISGLGKVVSQSTSTQDITGQYLDLEARLRAKTIQEDRLLKILGQAKSVGELLQVEGELTRVRADIESMQSQKQYYDKVTTLAALNLSITEEGSKIPGPPSPFALAWTSFTNAWGNLLICAAKESPYLIIGSGLLFLGYRYLRRRTKKRN